MIKPDFEITGRWIISARGKKNEIDPLNPYSWLVEKERTSSGSLEDVGIIFLTNRECPFHCLMCDLWKNTTDVTVKQGVIPLQIEKALSSMPAIKHLKLYNSGSFFDVKAIPESDYGRIADLVSDFDTVIVESHPHFVGRRCITFRDMLKPRLQVALGLETANRELLRLLNKKMTVSDFEKSVRYLSSNGISSRAFILLKPPFLSEDEGIYWAERSIDLAFDAGVECCTVIPVRAGNGAMEYLQGKGLFSPPCISSLEEVTEYGLSLDRGRVFADLWDITGFSTCSKCTDQRVQRLNNMNIEQKIPDKIDCYCN